MQKGTHLSISNLNNWRLGRLKVHVMNQEKSCTDRGNPTKKLNFYVTSNFKNSIFLQVNDKNKQSMDLPKEVRFALVEITAVRVGGAHSRRLHTSCYRVVVAHPPSCQSRRYTF